MHSKHKPEVYDKDNYSRALKWGQQWHLHLLWAESVGIGGSLVVKMYRSDNIVLLLQPVHGYVAGLVQGLYIYF